jgi:hypothetical protein
MGEIRCVQIGGLMNGFLGVAIQQRIGLRSSMEMDSEVLSRFSMKWKKVHNVEEVERMGFKRYSIPMKVILLLRKVNSKNF